jgi:hypothetical protein
VGKPEGSIPLAITRCKWEDCVIMELREVEWSDLNEDRGQRMASAYTVLNLRVPS